MANPTEDDFEHEFQEWIAEVEREIEATRQSEILSARDYEVIINAG